MHVPAAAVVLSVALLSVGCSQPHSPTSPTSATGRAAAIGADLVGSGAVAAAKETSFKGTLDGTFTFVADAPPSPYASVHLYATGVASHVGRFTLDVPHRVDLSTLPAAGNGTFALIAANGDQLTGQTEGLGTPIELPNVFSIAETYTVIAGTGRFAGATGSFTCERIVNLATLVTTGSCEGTIFTPQ